MCFLFSGKPPVIDESQNSKTSRVDHVAGPGIDVFQCRPYLPPSPEGQKQQKKVSKSEPFPKEFCESDGKPSPMKFSPNTTYVRSPSPVGNSDSDDTKDKKSKKTGSLDRKLASSETTYASNPPYSTDHFPKLITSDSDKPTTRKTGHESKYASNPLCSTDHFPKLINSDSDRPTTRKAGHESKLSPSPPPEKLNLKSAELPENITRRFPTSDEVTRNTTVSPTKAQDEQNAKASNTSSNNKKLMWNENEYTESPYKDAASSLHYRTAISDSEKDQNIP